MSRDVIGQNVRSQDPGPDEPPCPDAAVARGRLDLPELDCSTVPRLRTEIALAVADGPGNVVLDCAPLIFIGAGGVGTLVWAANLSAETGRPVTLLNAGPAMRRLLHVTRVQHRFTLEAT